MKISVSGVHHIMITVGDLEIAKNFYSSVLSFEEKVIPSEITGERIWYHLGPLQLHVNVHPQFKAGNSHFAITIDDGKYEDYIEQVRNSGYEKLTESKEFIDGMCRVYIQDPFGNCIEIIDGQMGD